MKLAVIGHGAAGLAAAVAAAEAAASSSRRGEITLVEKAAAEEAGGNSRWSPSNLRLAAPDRLTPGFVEEVIASTGGKGDRAYFERLAAEAVPVVQWLQAYGVRFIQPMYYLSAGPPRIQPEGGGAALVQTLTEAARDLGVHCLYETAAVDLIRDGGRIRGIAIASGGQTRTLAADAVILASGGFEGDPEMMRRHFGEHGATMPLIAPGTRFDSGDGIRMAAAIGATMSGDWHGMHAEPVDPRSRQSAPVVLVYPYGIVVDQQGRRFCDEGAGLVHETWEHFARDIHFNRPCSRAYAILDSKVCDIPDVGRAIRSEIPPWRADTIEDLARACSIDPRALRSTVDDFNAAVPDDAARFDPHRCDGLATRGDLVPRKSNWARALRDPPYLAFPLVGAVAYTFGGIATNAQAEVLGPGGPLPGLFAAGEVTGHFYGTAPNAVAMLRALVFGRIAGQRAVESLLRR